MIARPLPESIAPETARELAEIVGDRFLLKSDSDRIAYSKDCFPKMLIWARSAKYPHLPAVVCLPADENELINLLACLYHKNIPVIPYGGGSGVAGGTLPVKGGVIVDLKRLNRMIALDEFNHTVEAEAGIIGEHLEHYLNRKGFTLGHFPSSIMCSTLGGWLAARSAGQLSSRYGKIEDMVVSLRFALPSGKVIDFPRPVRTSFAKTPMPLIIGGEGAIGVITRATLRIHRLPQTRLYRGFRFKNVAAGIQAMRTLLQAGLSPACLRLYDELDTIIALDKKGGDGGIVKLPLIKELKEFFKTAKSSRRKLFDSALRTALKNPRLLNIAADKLPTGVLLIAGYEGEEELIRPIEEFSTSLLLQNGGEDLGRAPGERWLETRYNISFKQPPIFIAGAFNDTMEVATDWDNLITLYRAVKKALEPLAFVMAHFSHAYCDGCSIYFTFAGAEETDALSARKYDLIWQTALAAVLSTGATITHHHGIGFSKQAFLFQEYGALMSVHKALKDVLDERGNFNPDKLAFGAKTNRREKT
ncbi:MAG: FAD-binding oxidoreductase [Myxococcota bacterium]